MKIQSLFINQINRQLKLGKIGVIPTDTIYGIVGSALNPQTVEEIYKLRKRSTDKPMIILISALSDLKKFNIDLKPKQVDFLKKIWPNPVSVVLSCSSKKFKYLHRGRNSLAFRIPKNELLLKVLQQVGPLVAPSANLEGEPPAKNIEQASRIFAEKVDFYVDGGEVNHQSSTIIRLSDEGLPAVLRNRGVRLH